MGWEETDSPLKSLLPGSMKDIFQCLVPERASHQISLVFPLVLEFPSLPSEQFCWVPHHSFIGKDCSVWEGDQGICCMGAEPTLEARAGSGPSH